MTLEDLKALSTTGEGQYIEFKKNINHPNQIVEEVVGFANSKGGGLFIGIDDKGVLTGLKFADDDTAFIIDFIRKSIRPTPSFQFETITLTRKKAVIHLKIDSGDKKPYGVINPITNSTKIYYRVNDKCLQASRELKSILRGSSYATGQIIKYSDLEDEVLKILADNQPITKNYIREKSKFTSRKISDCLIRLVLAGVLSIIPTEQDDLYEFNHQN